MICVPSARKQRPESRRLRRSLATPIAGSGASCHGLYACLCDGRCTDNSSSCSGRGMNITDRALKRNQELSELIDSYGVPTIPLLGRHTFTSWAKWRAWKDNLCNEVENTHTHTRQSTRAELWSNISQDQALYDRNVRLAGPSQNDFSVLTGKLHPCGENSMVRQKAAEAVFLRGGHDSSQQPRPPIVLLSLTVRSKARVAMTLIAPRQMHIVAAACIKDFVAVRYGTQGR